MDPDSTICYCFHIPRRKVVNFVRQTLPKKASQISECFGAGSGCGWCIPFLVRIHREIVGRERTEEEPMTSSEYEDLRRKYLAGIRDGTVERNRHHADRVSGAPAPGAPEGDGAAGGAPGEESGSGEDLDYTRYFSRSRPDPDPETLR